MVNKYFPKKTPLNMALIEQYREFKKSKGNAPQTIFDQCNVMTYFDEWYKKDFKLVTKSDIEKFVTFLQTKYKKTTIEYRKLVLRNFFTWLHEQQLEKEISKVKEQMIKDGKNSFEIEEREWQLRKCRPRYPFCVDWLNIRMPTKTKTESSIFSPEEIEQIINKGCSTTQEVAIVSLFWDIMLREGQLCEINVGDITVKDGQWYVAINLDKGERRSIRVMESVPAIKDWLNLHQYKDNSKHPLFYVPTGGKKGSRYSENGIYQMIIRLGQNAGLDRHITPHLIRHSRNTYLKKIGVDLTTRNYIGCWKMTSKVADTTYLHANSDDFANDVLQKLGVEPTLVPPNNKMAVNICPRCNEGNSPNNIYCKKCSEPLTLETRQKQEDIIEKKIMEKAEELAEKVFKEIAETKQVITLDFKELKS